MEGEGENPKGTMKVAIMVDLEKMEFTTRPIPEPGPDEVLVKVAYVGVCGSDLHYYEHGRIGPFVVKCPFVLGHEASGIVVKTNSPTLKVGDRVCMEPGKTCGKCEFCVQGKYNLCPDVIFFATPPYDGVFCEYVVHKASLCFKLPDGMSLCEGALIEPLAVGFHAVNQTSAAPGLRAAVFGSGCIGLVSLLALGARGVSQVTVSDVVDGRLARAKELGAIRTVNVSKEKITDVAGSGFDIVIETSGAPSALTDAVAVTKKGGTIVLVGYPASGTSTLPVSWLLDKEITIRSIFRYRHIYPSAIDAVAAGRVNLKGIVSHQFKFDDVQEAMHRSIKEKNSVIKAVVVVSPEGE